METEELSSPLERRRPGPRRVPLDTLTGLVREIALEIDPRLDLLAVRGDGGEGYVELLIQMTACDHEPCRVTIGVDRTLDRTALERSLDKPLRDYLARAA